MPVHFQFNHSKRNKDLQTVSSFSLNLQIGFNTLFHIFLFFFFIWGKISFWMKRIESEVKTVLDLRVLKLQTTKNSNCWFSIQTAHSSIRILNCEISIKETTVHKKIKPREKAHFFVFYHFAVTEVWKILQSCTPPSSGPSGKLIHSYWRHPLQKNDRSQ